MAARPTAAVSIPRFLLPQLTWRAPHLRPAATVQSSSPRRQRRREQFHTSAIQHAQKKRAVDWTALSRTARPQDAEARLTKSLYRALRASLQPSSPLSLRTPGSSFPFSHSAFTAATALSSSSTPPSPSSSSLLQARAFHTSRAHRRDHHFDTLRFVQRLKDEGFSEAQATAMMRVLSDVIEESIQNLTRTMVLREDAERATYTQKVDFTKLRSELLSSDNTEAQLTRASHERLANDLAKLNSRLRDEIGRTQASVRLDLNLEKGRIREEANVQELKIKETEARIEQEVAGLRERVEGVKFSTLQWLMGVCTGTAAIILGAWRLLM